MPDDWVWNFQSVVDQYTRELGVSRVALASAIGFGNSMSPSDFLGPHELARYSRLCGCLNVGNVWATAARLALSEDKYEVLQQFFRDANEAVLGWNVEYTANTFWRRDVHDLARIGLEIYDQGDLPRSSGYIERAWGGMVGQVPHSPNELALFVITGTRLISIDDHVGAGPRTHLIVRDLLHIYRHHRNATDPLLIKAFGEFLIAAGISYRLAGKMSLLNVVGYSRMAVRELERVKDAADVQVEGLRDEAKPLILYALEIAGPRMASDLVDQAMARLSLSERLAEGHEEDPRYRKRWFFTHLTMIECLAALGRSEEARRLWDEMLEEQWIVAQLDPLLSTPLSQKASVTHMALLGSEKRYDDLASAASSFLRICDGAYYYAHRIERVHEIAKIAESPSNSALQHAILR